MNRRLYIAAYDVRNRRRLRRALEVLKGYASGGQRSVFECHLGEGERRHLLRDIVLVLDESEDRFLLVNIDEALDCHPIGIAQPPVDSDYIHVN